MSLSYAWHLIYIIGEYRLIGMMLTDASQGQFFYIDRNA
jgi:hypothetical protein